MLLVATTQGNFLVSWALDFSGKRPVTTCTIGNMNGTPLVSETVKQYHKDVPSVLNGKKFALAKALNSAFPEKQVEEKSPVRTKNYKQIRGAFWKSFTETVL